MTPTRRLTVLVSAVALPLAAGGIATASTAPPSSGPVECPDGRLRFGVEPYEDPEQLEPAYAVIAAALGDTLGCDVEISIVEDYTAEVLAIENGQLELAQFGPLGYVFAQQRAGVEAVASFGTADGELSTYTAGIWVPADSEIEGIDDLAGHSLALSEPGSTSGDALPRFALGEAGIEEADVDIQYAGGHPEALLALTNGAVDAAEINSQQQATAEAEGQFDPAEYREVWTSDPIPNDPITLRADLDPALKTAIADALLNLDADVIAEVGALLDVDPPGALIAVEQADYQQLFDLAAALGLTEQDA